MKIQAQLRGIVMAVAAGLASGHPYSPDTDLEDNTHLTAGRDQLLDVELLTTLERGPGLQEASVEELTRRRLLCYAYSSAPSSHGVCSSLSEVLCRC